MAAMAWRKVLSLLTFLVISAAGPAVAQPIHLRYEAHWGGLHAADFGLSFDVGPADYDNWFRLRTRGMTDWIARLDIEAHGQGRVSAGRPLEGRAYRVDYTNRWRSRTMAIRYDPDGGEAHTTLVTHQENEPDEDNELPREHRMGVLDPLTGLAEAIRRLRAHLEADGPPAFRLALFDGRRRFDLEGEFLGRKTRNILDRRHEVYHLRLTTRAVAGFKERFRGVWDGSAFDVYLTRDGRYLPLQIDSIGPGPLLNLVEECSGRCPLPVPER
ncbi:MAG: DUF3108 domain-containing protein [Magnetospirillum sp. WYHS-4]